MLLAVLRDKSLSLTNMPSFMFKTHLKKVQVTRSKLLRVSRYAFQVSSHISRKGAKGTKDCPPKASSPGSHGQNQTALISFPKFIETGIVEY
jgi:hypothetical protein